MKRKIAWIIALLICLGLVFQACTSDVSPSEPAQSAPTLTAGLGDDSVPSTPAATQEPAVTVGGVRIVVNGKVNQFDALLCGGDWYLAPSDIKAVLGVDAVAARDGYANLREVAKKADISYEHDSVLNAAYIWTDQPYGRASDDFSRAISLGLVPDSLQADAGRQITAAEFRSLLLAMINKLTPEKAAWFEENVTTYDKPLLRGEGYVMAFYAAKTVGADIANYGFDNAKADGGNFWDSSIYQLDALYPHVWDGPVKYLSGGDEWENYFVASFLWSFWYASPCSERQVFEYDEAVGSMRQNEPLTVREAVNAAVRIYDGFVAPAKYVPLDDAGAVAYDKSIITDGLLDKAKALPAIMRDNAPALKGFVLSYEDGSYDENDLRTIANWGFNSVRLMIKYQTFFDKDANQVDIGKVKHLDALISFAIKYNLHLNLLTSNLPGRWTSIDFSTYQTTGGLDLFTNPEMQKEANAVWAMLAERYKDIPGSALSFCPIWEAQNHNLSSGLPVPPYTDQDVANVYVQLVDTIKAHDPDRFIIFEPTANNSPQDILNESGSIKKAVQAKYPDALMMANFCETPFVYAEMTAVAGDNIDIQNHSMFKPEYPVTVYAAQYHLGKNTPLEISGALKAGTRIDLYLSQVDGKGVFTVNADGNALYSETLSTAKYGTDAPLSGLYPYAKSDKLISVTLPSDTAELQINYSGQWFEWSGADITLPSEYSVKRWWFSSGYDAMLSGGERPNPVLRETSTIMISPNSYDSGRQITVNEDISYTSGAIIAQSSKQTVDDWAMTMAAYSPYLVVRFEEAGFSIGCTHDSALRYYDDLLSALGKYGMSWYSNDYYSITHADTGLYAGLEPVRYNGYSIDAEMLKLMQQHQ